VSSWHDLGLLRWVEFLLPANRPMVMAGKHFQTAGEPESNVLYAAQRFIYTGKCAEKQSKVTIPEQPTVLSLHYMKRAVGGVVVQRATIPPMPLEGPLDTPFDKLTVLSQIEGPRILTIHRRAAPMWGRALRPPAGGG
jgi:hypothetical protein